MAITTRELAAIEPGEWLSDEGRRGAGRLLAFGMKGGGVTFYFRYTLPDGRRDTLPLGHYDAKGHGGLTLGQAGERAGELSRRYQAGERDLRAVLDAEQREGERQRAADEAATLAKDAKLRATLGALLTAYIAQMRRDGKESVRHVERALHLHVEDAWPKLWATPAEDIEPDDLLAVVAKLVHADKLREAAKVRSYLRAAYAAAIRARQDARALAVLRDLRIVTNPARDLVTIEGASKARERALSVAELRAYWRRIEKMTGADGALLRFHLLTGAQRVEQLARITTKDIDHDDGTVRILDPKGRRRKPRAHIVPLIDAAKDALRAMEGGMYGEFAFTADSGYTGASYYVAQHRLRPVVVAMREAQELDGDDFTLGDLRRTVETRLAAEGVSRETRAQLQSHGLGGIQDRHYDRHGYLDEKRAALETLYRLVAGKSATVTPIRKRKSA